MQCVENVKTEVSKLKSDRNINKCKSYSVISQAWVTKTLLKTLVKKGTVQVFLYAIMLLIFEGHYSVHFPIFTM